MGMKAWWLRCIACLLLFSRASPGFVPVQEARLMILAPLQFSVLHSSSVDLSFQVDSSNLDGVLDTVVMINGTEVLRAKIGGGISRPSVSLDGLDPGVCQLSVMLVAVAGGHVRAQDEVVFLISSHSSSPKLAEARALGPGDYAWQAVAWGSDDWGRTSDSIPVFAGLQELTQAKERGWEPGAWGKSSSETADDMYTLFDIIEGLNKISPVHQRLTLSPYWVVGGPDFEAMHRLGCPASKECEYRERRIDQGSGPTGAWPHSRGDLRKVYKSGFEAKLWHPQYHGRSHFDTRAWMHYLATDAVAQKWFRKGIVFCNDTSIDTNGRPRSLLSEHARVDPIPGVSDNNLTILSAWLEEGVSAFRSFWGYSPIVASMPHHASMQSLGDNLYDLGFMALDNNDLGPPLATTNRVGFEPCCLAQSLLDARPLVDDALGPRGNGHVNIQSHAQNLHRSARNATDYMDKVREIVELVLWIRRRHPSAVFVSVSELMQLKTQGWSREVWHDCLRYRNHLSTPVSVEMARHALFYNHSASLAGSYHEHSSKEAWEWDTIEIRRVPYRLTTDAQGADDEADCVTGRVGDQVDLLPGVMYEVRPAPGIHPGEACRAGEVKSKPGEEADVQRVVVKDVSPRIVYESVQGRGEIGARTESNTGNLSVMLGDEPKGLISCQWMGGGSRPVESLASSHPQSVGNRVTCSVPKDITRYSILYLRISQGGDHGRAPSSWNPIMVLPRGMAQAQPRALNQAWMAGEDWGGDMLSKGDVQMKLTRGLRVCLLCGCSGLLPGWINLEMKTSEQTCDIGGGMGAGSTLVGQALEWEWSDGLAFLPDQGLKEMVIGQSLRIDWEDKQQVDRAEELLDHVWRVLEPGGVVRVVRPTRLSYSAQEHSFLACSDISCAEKATSDVTHPPWEGPRFRCDSGGQDFKCKGQADDSSSLIALLERVGLEQYGEGSDDQDEGNAEHTVWPAVGGMGPLRIFHMRRPAKIEQ